MTRFGERVRAHLIDDLRCAWRYWSVRLHLAVLAFAGLYELAPALPPEVQAMLPEHLRPGVLGAYALAGLLARLMKQKANG
jgi:hypothetical protein